MEEEAQPPSFCTPLPCSIGVPVGERANDEVDNNVEKHLLRSMLW